MTTTFFPEIDAPAVEQEPGVVIDETDSALLVEFQIPAGELSELSVEVYDFVVAVGCERGSSSFRREFALPVDADTAAVSFCLDERGLSFRVPKRARGSRAPVGHLAGFHPNATPC